MVRMMETTWTTQHALRALKSSVDGLADGGIGDRRATYGWNELPRKERSKLLLFLRQFNSILIYILLAALFLTVALPVLEGGIWTGESLLEAGVILAILLLNALLGFVQEYKAEQAILMLENLTSPTSRVRRDGREKIIPSRELVPGDIVIVEAGDRIAADGRVIREAYLQMNESSLTGESAMADKTAEAIKETASSLGDRRNMVFAGTLVTRGSAEFVVTATGTHTEIGKIAKLVSQTRVPETPLARRMNQLSRIIGGTVLALSGVIVAVSLWQGRSVWAILLTGASLAVSAVPEGLPAVVTVCLAIGVRRMVRRNALVRRLDALETLGSVTVICADKTGTITENRMHVIETWTMNPDDADLLVQIGASCNRAQLPDLGDPTEIGLLELADERGVGRLPIDLEEMPFTSEERYMRTRHAEARTVSFLKGAPEKIASLCAGDNTAALLRNAELAKQGLRVIACAVAEGKGAPRFVGLLALTDPPRATVRAAIGEARKAGIRTIMITGDNLDTATAIARKIGIKGKAMLGEDIDKLTPAKLRTCVKTVGVFARAEPRHKLLILDALKANGEIVAMSGDGVNDAPALKGAHVGVAMGKVGTDVAREAASIVLADDDYATIVAAVREGRHIYDNIRKFVLYLVRANFDEILFLLVTTLMGLPLPYLPLHILWINLMTDSLPALALSMEPEERDIMERAPRKPSEHLFAGQMTSLVLATLLGFALTFFTYLFALTRTGDTAHARTLALTLAIFFELFLAYSARSSRPFWRVPLFSNPWLLVALAIPLASHFLLLFTPLGGVFSITRLTAIELLVLGAAGASGFLFFEIAKAATGGARRRSSATMA